MRTLFEMLAAVCLSALLCIGITWVLAAALPDRPAKALPPPPEDIVLLRKIEAHTKQTADDIRSMRGELTGDKERELEGAFK
jgi:hypothetical protein